MDIQCKRCDEVKDSSLFCKHNGYKNGHVSWCRACVSEYNIARGRYHKVIIDRYKTIVGCTDCGYRAHAEALYFDHLPQFEKRFEVCARNYNKARKTILAEMAKCEVVCSNCHRVRTARRR